MTQDDKKICQEALDLIEQYGNAAAAEAATGVSQRTLRDRAERGLKRHGLKVAKIAKAAPAASVKVREVEPQELLAADRKVRTVVEDKKGLAAKLKASEAEVKELQEQVGLLTEIEAGQGGDRPKLARYANTDGGNGIFVGVLSDLHLEEDVSPESIPGFDNKFNPDIAKKRMEKLFTSYVFMLDAWRSVGACDTAVMAILGDVITGYIHEELKESNHMSPSEAILYGQELIGTGIEFILKEADLKKLIIPCCYGNHGRTTLKSQIQTGAENSFEYLLYKTMEREWRREARIDWHVAQGYHMNLDLMGTRVRFHHGDAINYGGGIGGITVPIRKKIQGWNQNNPKPAHLDVMGHFHQAMDGGNFLVNGSLVGFNAYALHIGAAYEPPQQLCFWIDSERGKTMTGRLFVE